MIAPTGPSLWLEREELLDAVKLNSVQFTLARAIGPGFAGLVVSTLGTGAAIFINAITFLLVIAGLHLLHLVGGVIAIAVISLKALAAKSSTNQVLSVELVASYWHFVDILWIYLFVFLNWVG